MSDNDVCSYADQDWQFWDTDPTAPMLICDTHGFPAGFEVYACEPGEETGKCQWVMDWEGVAR